MGHFTSYCTNSCCPPVLLLLLLATFQCSLWAGLHSVLENWQVTGIGLLIIHCWQSFLVPITFYDEGNKLQLETITLTAKSQQCHGKPPHTSGFSYFGKIMASKRAYELNTSIWALITSPVPYAMTLNHPKNLLSRTYIFL